MANLVLAFAELLVGAVVLDAGIKGAKLSDVVKGQASQSPISGLSVSAPSSSSAATTTGSSSSSTGGSGSSSTGGSGITLPGGGRTGKISWFNDSTTASGISAATTPGIAVADSSTLGGYWLMKLASGREFVVKQIDYGPAGWTGRLFDFSAPLQQRVGNPATDSSATGVYLGKTIPAQYRSLLIS